MRQPTEQRATVTNDAPNIIYVLADDKGYGDMGCNDPECQIPTPNVDRLAERGIRMTDAHATSAVCTPSIGKWHLGWDWATKDGTHPNDTLPFGQYCDPERAAFEDDRVIEAPSSPAGLSLRSKPQPTTRPRSSSTTHSRVRIRPSRRTKNSRGRAASGTMATSCAKSTAHG